MALSESAVQESDAAAGIAVPADPALPQLDIALNAARMSALLPPIEGGWRIGYVRYKPHTSCIVRYDPAAAPAPGRWAYAKLFSEEPTTRLAAKPAGCDYRVEGRMAVLTFPNDFAMPSLRPAMMPDGHRAIWGRVLHAWKAGDGAVSGTWQPVRYKPERRCVFRGQYAADGGRGLRGFFARAYAGAEGLRTAEWHRHLYRCTHPCLRVPRCLGYSATHRLLAVRELKGQPLRELLRANRGELQAAIELAARALALWHRLPPPPGAPGAAKQIPVPAASAADHLLHGHPAAASELARILAATEPGEDSPVLIHGDFTPDQVLIRAVGVGFLDLDRLSIGDPLQDVASFCAHVVDASHRGDLSTARAGLVRDLFLDAYGRVSGTAISSARLRWHLATALLKLADAPFRRFDFNWPAQISRLVEAAAACMRV